MKNDLKNQVVIKLIKWGNNPNDSKIMVDQLFEKANNGQRSVSEMANWIRTCY